MPSETQSDYYEKAIELERLERIHRCEGNLLEFSIQYFSDARNPDNDGNWQGFDISHIGEAAKFHRELTDMMNEVSVDRPNDKVAAAIARSHGKSTYLSRAFPISEVVYRKRRYIITISETPTVAKANMEWIRSQLKYNEKLREDFGPLLSPKDQSNISDNSEEFIAWHPTESGGKKQLTIVQAASTGQALRGRNWNGNRPDLIICDDLEDARPGGNASTPEQRTKLRQWFFSTVMPLGDPKGAKTAFVVMGTTVNRYALLMHILHERADFRSKVYRAIIEQPKRADLWEECRLIYIDRENPMRAEDARRFYEENREEMDRGVKVLWPEVQPIWKLMTWKWDNGSLAFNTEYMNNPIDEENMIFNPENFTYYTHSIDVSNDIYDVSMGVDFALGKERGDYSAITVTARNKDTGAMYVVDSWGERIKPDEFMKIIVEKVQKYQPTIIGVESQMAQEFFADELKKALRAVGYPADTRVKKIYQRSRKELRIEAMLPNIENGTIKFSKKHALLLEQFESYGSGGHDDLPDSLEISVSVLKSSFRRKAGNAGSYRY
jgi:predicted phage terminase large subunit-like protein